MALGDRIPLGGGLDEGPRPPPPPEGRIEPASTEAAGPRVRSCYQGGIPDPSLALGSKELPETTGAVSKLMIRPRTANRQTYAPSSSHFSPQIARLYQLLGITTFPTTLLQCRSPALRLAQRTTSKRKPLAKEQNQSLAKQISGPRARWRLTGAKEKSMVKDVFSLSAQWLCCSLLLLFGFFPSPQILGGFFSSFSFNIGEGIELRHSCTMFRSHLDA